LHEPLTARRGQIALAVTQSLTGTSIKRALACPSAAAGQMDWQRVCMATYDDGWGGGRLVTD